ncbi:MAG TPA: glycoside hydrolase family 30 beta sandwich domain-containing protein [Terracidiphilus sp.]|jgi:glucuronoarabinoxylan endo-1,4-beta-xylanase|nr:glycoside hydrolase family 30 beta sandwich domain-containing protein [Terracidiphilus sp.]
MITQRTLALPLLFAAILAFPIAATAASPTVTVDYSKPLQTIQGFGASITWIAADLPNFTSADQTAILDALYNTNVASAGLSWIRVGTMLCQFNPSSGTYNFNDPLIQGEVNWVKRVNSTYGGHNVFASTWTPPAWMKSNNSCSNGGSLNTANYGDFANTMVAWLQNWKSAVGSEVNVESLQNEPNENVSYDSCVYTPAQINAVSTGYLVPALRNAGLTSLYTVPEPSVYGGSSYFASNWATPILSDNVMASDVSFMSTHGYGQLQNLAQPCTVCQQYGKQIWQTEVMKDNTGYTATISEAQTWSTSIYQALNKGGFSAWFYWWAMNYSNDNQGLVNYSNTAWTYQIPKRVYVIGNFSRFMRPGSTLLTSTSSSSALESTAALPTAGKIAMVLSNTGASSMTVSVTLQNASSLPTSVTPYVTSSTQNQAPQTAIPVGINGTFTVTIAAHSVVTLIG